MAVDGVLRAYLLVITFVSPVEVDWVKHVRFSEATTTDDVLVIRRVGKWQDNCTSMLCNTLHYVLIATWFLFILYLNTDVCVTKTARKNAVLLSLINCKSVVGREKVDVLYFSKRQIKEWLGMSNHLQLSRREQPQLNTSTYGWLLLVTDVAHMCACSPVRPLFLRVSLTLPSRERSYELRSSDWSWALKTEAWRLMSIGDWRVK